MDSKSSPTFAGSAKARLLARAATRRESSQLDTSRLMETARSKSATPPLMRSGPVAVLRPRNCRPQQQTEAPLTARAVNCPELAPLIDDVRTAAKALTVHAIKALRDMPCPSENERNVCGAFLSLFSEIDNRIEAAPSFKVLRSAFWDAMVNYAAKPGHVTQMARRFPELALAGKISECEVYAAAATRARRQLNTVNEMALRQRRSALMPFFQYTKSCLSLHCAVLAQRRITPKEPQLRKPRIDPLNQTQFSSFCSLSYSNSKENSPVAVERSPERSESPVDTVRELQWRLDDALRLFLREKLWAQPDVVSYIAEQGDALMAEFSASVLYVTRDLPESLQTAGVQPFLASLRKATVLRDVVRVITMLTPAEA